MPKCHMSAILKACMVDISKYVTDISLIVLPMGPVSLNTYRNMFDTDQTGLYMMNIKRFSVEMATIFDLVRIHGNHVGKKWKKILWVLIDKVMLKNTGCKNLYERFTPLLIST